MINQFSSLVEPRVGSFDPPAGFLTRSTLEASQEGFPIFTIWFPFVDDLGHTLNVTTQDTRYVSYRYWHHRVSQSNKHMSAYFLVKYFWIRS